jgi:diguanylate cyclase (GGDEF)-like protein
VNEVIARKGRFVGTALSVGGSLLVLAIGYLDYLTGPEIGFSLFYVAPVMLVSWYLYKSRVWAVAIPVLSAAVWLLADIFSGHQYSSPWIAWWNMAIRLGIFLVIGLTVSRLRLSNANEKVLSRTDALTGAVNSRYFAELAAREISRSTRSSEPFTFAYLDVDNFKTINDSLGHAQGDELLQTMTEAIRARIRDIDIIARLGGDEFGLLLPRTDAAQAAAVMDKVSAVFRESIATRWNVTLSAGVLTFRRPPAGSDEMVKAADALMYRSKREGKDRASFEVVA